MIAGLLLAWLATAQAQEVWLVRDGDTIESIAHRTGVPQAGLRAQNGLAEGIEPAVGDLLYLPDRAGRRVDVPAALSAIQGQGTAQIGTRPAVPLELGMDLPTGTRVCIDAASYATIRLAYDPFTLRHDDVLMLPGTCLVVTATAGGGRGPRSSTILVEQGSVSIRAEKDPGAVNVITPSGISSGERGGFRVTIEDDASRTEALYEQVVVIGAGQELVVDSGYGTRIESGEAPQEVTALLLPGTPVVPESGDALLRPAFSWTDVDRALGYRIEFSSVPDFSELVLVEETESSPWTPDVLFLPFRVPGLWWRVVAFDRTGFAGLPSESRFLVFPAGVGP